MKSKEFQRLASGVDQLTPHQKQLLVDILRKPEQVGVVSQLIEDRLGEGPKCPHCDHEKVSRWGVSSGLQRYRCGSCKSTFNALTGTPLARLRHKDKWLTYTEQMADGRSVRKSAQACQVHRNTAFRWRHRFLKLPKDQRATQLSGIAEADETVFLESFKGRKGGLPRAAAATWGQSGEARAVGRTNSGTDLPGPKRQYGRLCRRESGPEASWCGAQTAAADRRHPVYR